VTRLGGSDIFVDTSILVTLTRTSKLHLLWQVYPDRLIIPDAVHLEILGQNLTLPLGSRIKRRTTKPFWNEMAIKVAEAIKSGQLRTAEPRSVEETLAFTLVSTGEMHPGEAMVYAMASNRNGICCSMDMSALRKRCEINRIPLLGIFGIIHDALAEKVLTESEAESFLEALANSEDRLPRVRLLDVRAWFDKKEGMPLFD